MRRESQAVASCRAGHLVLAHAQAGEDSARTKLRPMARTGAGCDDRDRWRDVQADGIESARRHGRGGWLRRHEEGMRPKDEERPHIHGAMRPMEAEGC